MGERILVRFYPATTSLNRRTKWISQIFLIIIGLLMIAVTLFCIEISREVSMSESAPVPAPSKIIHSGVITTEQSRGRTTESLPLSDFQVSRQSTITL